VIYNKDIPVTLSYTGQSLDSDEVATPCGLIGKYRFTDRFTIMDENSDIVMIDSGSIAHSNDKDIKFKNTDSNGATQWLDHEDQHLMVWYQMESFPNFLKMYGEIGQTLSKGTYSVTVMNQWDTKIFKGEKSIYFSTVNGLGGTNVFLGVVFIVMAIVVLAIMVAIVVLEFTKGSKANHYSIDDFKR